MTREEFKKSCKTPEDSQSITRADILKANLMPEPEGVKFVVEGILGSRLRKEYLTWRINKVTRIYHKEGPDHFRCRRFDFQMHKNYLWITMYELNHPEIFYTNFKSYRYRIMRYIAHAIIVKKKDPDFVRRYPLNGAKNNFWRLLFTSPMKIALPFYLFYRWIRRSIRNRVKKIS